MGKSDLWERLELPGESLPGQVLVEILGDNRVLIEHHRGVCEYSQERIGVNAKFGIVVVYGSQLELRSMTRAQLIITGKIDGISLKRRDCK